MGRRKTLTADMALRQMRKVATDDLSKMNPPKFEKAEDIADLTFLNEASVVHNLRQRYFSGLIYTYSGLFLVAVNPYHPLPIYTDAIVAAYKGRRREENAPHVYALADGAMRNMLEARENQSLLITGESGAGKTENTKKVIQYLAAVALDPAGNNGASTPNSNGAGPPTLTRTPSSRHVMDQLRGVEGLASKRLGLLERQILQANPILEAFGNAQTIRNNNSSRFGKFVRIEFTSAGSIAGANIDWYLLEKSRVTNRSEKERNFHIFYQLLRGDDEKLKSKLLLTSSPENYGYLKHSRKHVEGIDDTHEWRALIEALSVVGFTPEEQTNLFRVVAAILQVGNIELADDRSEQARITNAAQVEKVCHVLGLPEQELTKALLRPRVKAGREWVTQSRTRRQVIDEMAALCKTLYEKTFAHIVERINRALDRPTSKSTFIGVLDIAGFEIFETNSFEQLCINYTNEKLQQFFNHHMFVLEQEEYARENIEWDFVNFGLDLQPTIDLIESTSPIGILSCLDEECIMPKATDLTFTEKLDRQWSTNKDGSAKDTAGEEMARERGVAHGSTKYAPARFAQGFTIKHYAGDVEYRTDGWLDKNKDPLNDNLTRVMSESTDRFVASLFAEYAAEDDNTSSGAVIGGPGSAAPPKRRIKRGAFRTVGQRHKEQLSSLMTQLGSTQPHFVRCIVPNPDKKPGKMDVPLVLEQLRCNGVLEGIRIARLGYPNRLPFTEFRNRYEVLTPGIIPKGYMDGRKACQRMVEALEMDRASFKVGLTKIFFKAGILAELEEKRDAHLYDIFARFQGACRMFTARRQMKKILNRASAVRTIQRNARLYVQLREWPWWQLYSKVRPLLKATRHDEELKRKQLELAMVTERAERDQKEREALEALRFKLENDKKRVEADLESERALLVDKDQLLARSKERESALEEDLASMQADIDQLDNQLERAIAGQRAAEQARDELKSAFDAAAEHLIRLEAEQQQWQSKETTLIASAGQHSEELDKLKVERQALSSEKSELSLKLREREQDLERTQKRLTAAVAEVEGKLKQEVQAREADKSRLAEIEDRSRQSSHQLSELARASNDNEERLKKKEAEVAAANAAATSAAKERDTLSKEISTLQVRVETLLGDLRSAKSQSQRNVEATAQVQKELDETRKLMEAKSSEDSKQREVQRMKEQELQSLRQQMTTLQSDLQSAKHSSLEEVNSLKAQAEASKKQLEDLSRSVAELKSKLAANERRMSELQAATTAAETAKRSAEDELASLRERMSGTEKAVLEAKGAKDAIEKQLTAANAKFQDLEDAHLELERGQSAWKLKHDQATMELSAESKRRELLESAARQHERVAQTLTQQHGVKDKELARLKEELAETQAELKKTQSMTNKTIVEHVHVLEEAKRYTDRQLADAQAKLQELAHYTKTLEKSKARLANENEDLGRENQRLQHESRSAGRDITSMGNIAPSGQRGGDTKALRSLETKVSELQTSLRDARRERDEAQSNARRKDLQLDETLSRTKQQYEARIVDLERELRGSQNARSTTFQNLQDLVEKSAERNGASDDLNFRRRLLEELRAGNDELEVDIAQKADMLRSHKVNGSATSPLSSSKRDSKPLYTFGNIAPSGRGLSSNVAAKRASLTPTSPVTPTAASNGFHSNDAMSSNKKANDLQKQLDALEVQFQTGMRVRQHLEATLRDVMADMESQGGQRFSLDAARRKLSQENQRLQALLLDEEEARKSAEMALLSGEASMRKDFSNRLAKLSGPSRDDEMRKALIAEQRTATAELAKMQESVASMRRSNANLENALAETRQRLERESIAKNEEVGEKRRLQTALQELQINSASSSHTVAEAKDAAQHFKAKAEEYRSQLDNLSMDKLKAQKAESLAKLSLSDSERALADSVRERKACEEIIEDLESQLREASLRLRQGGQDWNEVESMRRRMADEFDAERSRYRADLAQREELIESSRRRFQQELDAVAAEIDAHRSAVAQLREENRNLRMAQEELEIQLDDGAHSMGGWQKEKNLLEARIGDLQKAYQDSLSAQREGQAQSMALLEQIRDQRVALDESEMKYSQLQAQYNSVVNEAGADEDVINSLERAVERYRTQAQMHFENWKQSTEELQTQTKQLRSQATLRRPGSIPPDGLASPSRMSFRSS